MRESIRTQYTPLRVHKDSGDKLTIEAIARHTGVLKYRTDSGDRLELVPPDLIDATDDDGRPVMGWLAGAPATREHPPQLIRYDKSARKAYEVGKVQDELHIYEDSDGIRKVKVRMDVTDPDTIEDIRSGRKTGVSMGYSCRVRKDSGSYQGQQYTHVQDMPLQIDHLAIVASPRAPEALITKFDSSDIDYAWAVPEEDVVESGQAINVIHVDACCEACAGKDPKKKAKKKMDSLVIPFRSGLIETPVDTLKELHADGIIELVEIADQEFLVGADIAEDMRQDGILHNDRSSRGVYTPQRRRRGPARPTVKVIRNARSRRRRDSDDSMRSRIDALLERFDKTCGRGWSPGPGGKCKRNEKGTAKRLKKESAGVGALGKSKLSDKNKARLAELRAKAAKKSATASRSEKAKKAAATGVPQEKRALGRIAKGGRGESAANFARRSRLQSKFGGTAEDRAAKKKSIEQRTKKASATKAARKAAKAEVAKLGTGKLSPEKQARMQTLKRRLGAKKRLAESAKGSTEKRFFAAKAAKGSKKGARARTMEIKGTRKPDESRIRNEQEIDRAVRDLSGPIRLGKKAKAAMAREKAEMESLAKDFEDILSSPTDKKNVARAGRALKRKGAGAGKQLSRDLDNILDPPASKPKARKKRTTRKRKK